MSRYSALSDLPNVPDADGISFVLELRGMFCFAKAPAATNKAALEPVCGHRFHKKNPSRWDDEQILCALRSADRPRR